MPNRFRFLFLTLVLFAAGCSSQAQSPPSRLSRSRRLHRTCKPTPVSVTPALTVAFDAGRAFEDNRKLAVDIGKRVAGTPGGQAAADYIAGEFQKSGLEVTRQPFPFEAWEDHGTTVQLSGPQMVVLEAAPIQYSPGGKVDADVALVPGLGSRDDFSESECARQDCAGEARHTNVWRKGRKRGASGRGGGADLQRQAPTL